MKARDFSLFALFIGVAIYIGLSVTLNSWDGIVFFYPNEDHRQPAGINRVYDYSHLEGRALEMASQERILSAARVVHESGTVGVELGHFVTKNENNVKNFACKTFKTLELKFQSSDIMVSGEPSQMTVESDCISNKDINRIDAIWIPYNMVVEQTPGDIDLQFLGDRPVNLMFKNIGDSWPKKWSLVSVRLYNDTGRNITIGQKAMLKILKKPLLLEWDRQPASEY